MQLLLLNQLFKSSGMKQGILRNWNFMRFVRLGVGIAIIVQSVIVKDLTMGIAGILLTCMPLFNIVVAAWVVVIHRLIKRSKLQKT